MLRLKYVLLTLTIALVTLFASSGYAQSCDAVINECEEIVTAMQQERNQAIRDTDAVETERDVEAGKRQTFEKLYNQERTQRLWLEREQKKAPSRLLWFGLGAGAGAVVSTGLAILLSGLSK